MTKYETVKRIERVEITYRRGLRIAEGQKSKVYRVRTNRFPSGSQYELLVWSKELDKCIWVRADDVMILSMSINPIHTV